MVAGLNLFIQDIGEVTLTQAGGQQTQLLGSTWMILQFPDANTFPRHKELLQACVIDSCPTQLLLGTDFLCRFSHTTYLWRKPEIQFGPHRVPLLYNLFLGDSQRGFIHSEENIRIPPYTSMMVLVSVQTQYTEQEAVQSEPTEPSNNNSKLFIASSIGTPKNGKIPINMLNPTPTPITVYRSTKLGKVWVYRDKTKDPLCCANSLNETPSTRPPMLDMSRVRIESTLSEAEKNRLLSLISDYSSLFVQDDNDLIHTNMITHSIDTGDHPPIRQQPYRTAQNQRAIIEAEIKKMLEKGVIRQSQSPWSGPVVMVPKKTGGFRFYINYRKLNAATKKDSFPLPRIDDILETLNNCTCFTTLDQAAGYWQLPVDNKDKEKTAFVTYNGLLEFNVVPFGLCNAPATFQRLMNLLMAGLHWQVCLIYLDDILIFSKNFDDKLQEAGLKLWLEKCHFAWLRNFGGRHRSRSAES